MEFNEAAMKEILTALKEVSSKGFVTFDEVENNLDKMKFDRRSNTRSCTSFLKTTA